MENQKVATEVVEQQVAQNPEDINVLNPNGVNEVKKTEKAKSWISRTYHRVADGTRKFFSHPVVKAVGRGAAYVAGAAAAGAAAGVAGYVAIDALEKRSAKKNENVDAIEVETTVELITESSEQPEILPDDFDSREV